MGANRHRRRLLSAAHVAALRAAAWALDEALGRKAIGPPGTRLGQRSQGRSGGAIDHERQPEETLGAWMQRYPDVHVYLVAASRVPPSFWPTTISPFGHPRSSPHNPHLLCLRHCRAGLPPVPQNL